jgi:hypothetical protein
LVNGDCNDSGALGEHEEFIRRTSHGRAPFVPRPTAHDSRFRGSRLAALRDTPNGFRSIKPVVSLAQAASFDRARSGRVLVKDRSASAQVLPALLLIAVVAPFERPIFTAPGGFTVTTVEAALLLALAIGAAVVLRMPGSLFRERAIVLPGAAFLAVLCVAALLAPEHRGNALKLVARLTAGAGLLLLTASYVDSGARARLVVGSLLATGSFVAGVAVLEAAQVPGVMDALTAFRPGFHVVGGQLRATSTLFYPTIASMYLEIVFALGLWLLVEPTSSRQRGVVFAALVIVGAGIIATFTRAGLLGMAAALMLVAALRRLDVRQFDRGQLWLAALGVTVMAMVLASRSPDLLLTRLRVEGSQEWYGAIYTVPETLSLQTAREYRVPVTLENTGRLVWDSQREPAFAMSYHWLRADTEAVVQFDGWRTAFPTPVAPGARVTLPVDVKAPPQPGKYALVWDVVHEGRAWLSTEGVAAPRTAVDVEGVPAGELTTTRDRLPVATVRPDRRTLWLAALRMVREHPVLGIGPDNFRHLYGPYARLPRWDTRVHANNMYLEVLVGAGIVGLVAFLVLLARWGAWLLIRWQNGYSRARAAIAATLAAGLMVLGHGLVDSFLSFTTTYVMFAIAAGLACSRGVVGTKVPPRRVNADRV